MMELPGGLLTALQKARKVLVLTGAGMSAESGVPTFRDAQTGLWARYKAEQLATPEAFRENPQTVWGWYEDRRRNIHSALLMQLTRKIKCTLYVTPVLGGGERYRAVTKPGQLFTQIIRKIFCISYIGSKVPLIDHENTRLVLLAD